MNKKWTRVLSVLSILALSGVGVARSVDEIRTDQPPQPLDAPGAVEPGVAKAAAEAPPGAPSAGQAAMQTPAAPAQDAQTTETPEAGAQPSVEGKGAEAGADLGAAEPKEEVAPEGPPEPVTGAFGVPLGESFEPCLVAKVLAEEERGYRGADQREHQGTLYRVEPLSPHPHFSTYTVETTEDGTVYRIRADYEAPDKATRCAAVKKIAAELEQRYGKARGKGYQGAWYAFRDFTAEGYRGIRLNGVRCGRGIYSISYEDATYTLGPLPGQVKAAEGEPRKRTQIVVPARPGRPGDPLGARPPVEAAPGESGAPAEPPEAMRPSLPAEATPPPEPSPPAAAPGT